MHNCDRRRFRKVVASDSGLVGCMQYQQSRMMTFDSELDVSGKNPGTSVIILIDQNWK